MNKLKQIPLPIPRHTRMQVLRNTRDTRAYSREIGQYKQTKCAYRSAYVHPHAVYMHTYTQTYIYTYTYIYTCTYTRIHAHTYTFACICTRMHRSEILVTTPQCVKQYHRRTYASICIYMHIHTYIHIHICAQPAATVFSDVYVGV